jgi:hypothetical protein
MVDQEVKHSSQHKILVARKLQLAGDKTVTAIPQRLAERLRRFKSKRMSLTPAFLAFTG